MVLRVCRTYLRNSHDVEDAFQATFLVLVRRAGSIWVRDSLGPWLYDVARRVSLDARKNGIRRRMHEQRIGARIGFERPDSVDRIDREDAERLLRQELSALPSCYQGPLVLCYLEGMTHEQAASHLRCPVGTVRSRLARGRERLLKRLVRRGVTPAVFIGLVSKGRSDSLSISPGLYEATVASAKALVRGSSFGVSASVLRLVEGDWMAMFISKSKVLVASFLAIVVLGTGAGLLARQDVPKSNTPPAEQGIIEGSDSTAPRNASPGTPVGRPVNRQHAILAPPGSEVRIFVKTTDGHQIRCDARVDENGVLQITQSSEDSAKRERMDIKTQRTEILISPYVTPARDASTLESDLPRKTAWKETRVDSGGGLSLEPRLRDVEQKLDHVLRLLEKRSPMSQDPLKPAINTPKS
jgi:RNA polymerase sigma factor (sigma-70 family)